jgi:hypothetical protein
MSRRPSRLAARTLLALLLGVQVVAFGAVPASAADKGFALDLAAKGDYVAQTNFVQCVGASMQMMLNMVNPKNDRTAKTQLRLQNIARDLSGTRSDGRQRKGASVRGWSAGLNQLGAGPYRLVGAATLDEALRLAAASIRQTNRPVGLLVWRGRHAWVMSGFKATADPLRTSNYKVTAAIVMDPLYPHGSAVWGPSPKPRQALSPKALGRQFVPRRGNASWPGNPIDPAAQRTMSALSGKYVLVLPYETIPTGRLYHVAR